MTLRNLTPKSSEILAIRASNTLSTKVQGGIGAGWSPIGYEGLVNSCKRQVHSRLLWSCHNFVGYSYENWGSFGPGIYLVHFILHTASKEHIDDTRAALHAMTSPTGESLAAVSVHRDISSTQDLKVALKKHQQHSKASPVKMQSKITHIDGLFSDFPSHSPTHWPRQVHIHFFRLVHSEQRGFFVAPLPKRFSHCFDLSSGWSSAFQQSRASPGSTVYLMLSSFEPCFESTSCCGLRWSYTAVGSPSYPLKISPPERANGWKLCVPAAKQPGTQEVWIPKSFIQQKL